MSRKKVFISPSTHWDREWVMTKGQFQVRLVNLIDNLIKIFEMNPGYIFLFDGQTIPIEDYLVIKPENRDKIVNFIKTKQLVVGPWYVLADQFLENGESMIRNMMLGMKMIRELGGEPMMEGYVPDSFGSIASLPMILNGFGIGFASFGRGRPSRKILPQNEFLWETKDGSSVLAANYGYGNGIFLSYPDIWTDIFSVSSFNPDPGAILETFMAAAAGQSDATSTDSLYFNVGVDHMEPRMNLIDIIRFINENQTSYELIFATIYDYLQTVKKAGPQLKRYAGEMRGSDEIPMDLVGTLSSHIYIKQKNDFCESILQKVVEPLCIMAESLAGVEYPDGHIRRLWKNLLQNHPHDSICGCSIDQVNRDIMNRFQDIEYTSEYLIKEALHGISGRIDTRHPDMEAIPVIVFNPLGRRFTGYVKSIIRIPRKFRYDNYSVYDKEGIQVCSRIIHLTDKQKDLESVYMTNNQLASGYSKTAGIQTENRNIFTMLEAEMLVNDVPAMGYKTYWLKADIEEKDNNAPADFSTLKNTMENQWLRVDLNKNGTFDIYDKKTGHLSRNLNVFIDRADTGDTYDHHSPEINADIRSDGFQAEWVREATMNGCSAFSAVICIPDMPIKLTVELNELTPRVDVTAELVNIRKNHCLRVAFDTGIKTQVASAYDHFNVIERKIITEKPEWRDTPFQEFVDVSDGSKGFCLSTKGLPAYEAVGCGPNVLIYLTLLRAVEMIGPAAGANYPVESAQCIGKHKFEYSIIPHAGNWIEGDCLGLAGDYRAQIFIEADLQHAGIHPFESELLKLDLYDKKPDVFFSCMKKAQDGNGVILRIWNPVDNREAAFDSHIPIRSIEMNDLSEIKIPDSIHFNKNEPIKLKGHGLTTFRFDF
ncbi:MAG: alpha-mannosidase [Saccharofermentanales bacterium]